MFRRCWENRIDLHSELKQQVNALLEGNCQRMAEATLWHALLRNHQLSDPEGVWNAEKMQSGAEKKVSECSPKDTITDMNQSITILVNVKSIDSE